MAEVSVNIRAKVEVTLEISLSSMLGLLALIKEQEQELHNLRTRCDGLNDRLRKNGGE